MTGQQPYEVAERRDGFELRRYPAHLVAEIEVGGSFDEAPDRAFRPLAGLSTARLSAKPKAPPASAFTAATEYSRPR
jgi:hypothetical protein